MYLFIQTFSTYSPQAQREQGFFMACFVCIIASTRLNDTEQKCQEKDTQPFKCRTVCPSPCGVE